MEHMWFVAQGLIHCTTLGKTEQACVAAQNLAQNPKPNGIGQVSVSY